MPFKYLRGIAVHGEFQSKIMSIQDVVTLENLREELALQATDTKVGWDERMHIYKKIQTIVERLVQLEKE